MFAAKELSADGFLGGRLTVLQPIHGYRAAMDAAFLAAAVPALSGDTVLELGCGAGVASLCLGARVPGLDLTGLELQPAYADLAQRNARANDISLSVLCADLAAMPAALKARRFDHVIANPPYFVPKSGTAAADTGRETALREATPLPDWIEAGLRRLTPRGWFTLIAASDRLPILLSLLTGRCGDITVLPMQSRAGRNASRVVIRARKGARGPFTLRAPFLIHSGPEHSDALDHTPEAAEILRHGAALGI